MANRGVYSLTYDTVADTSRVWYLEDVTAYPLAWNAGDTVSGEYTELRLGNAAGKVMILGTESSASTPANTWDIGTGSFPGGTITDRTDNTITVTSTDVGGGRQQICLMSSGLNDCAQVSYEVLSGGYTDFVDWIDCGDARTVPNINFGFLNGNCCNMVLAFTDTTGVFSMRFTFVIDELCGDGAVISALTAFSSDYGATFGTPQIAGASAFGGVDYQKAGSNYLCSVDGETKISDAGGAWATFGTPHGNGAIFCPRYLLTAPATGNSSANPQYLLALYAPDGSGHSVFAVSSAGDAYSNKTPTYGGYPGLAVSSRCITGCWQDSNMWAAILSFNGDRRLCVTIDNGASYVLSDVLPSDADNVTMQRGDRRKMLIGFTADGKVKICRNARAATLTITDRILPLDAPIAALDVFG